MKKNRIIWIFLIVQSILYFWFLTLDLTEGSISLSTMLKFGMIVFCLLYVLQRNRENITTEINLLRLALFFTLISDLIILFLSSKYYVLGVITFVFAQQCHGLRLTVIELDYVSKDNKDRRDNKDIKVNKGIMTNWTKLSLLQLPMTLLLCLLLIWLEVTIDVLLMVTAFYFICLISNVIRSVKLAIRFKGSKNLLYAAGMVLFLFCDISVGLFNLSDFIALPSATYNMLYAWSAVLMWVFYAPSQSLIALSARTDIAIMPKE